MSQLAADPADPANSPRPQVEAREAAGDAEGPRGEAIAPRARGVALAPRLKSAKSAKMPKGQKPKRRAIGEPGRLSSRRS